MVKEEVEDLIKGKLYTIPKMEYHRLIKRTDKLVLNIWEEKTMSRPMSTTNG